MPKNKPPKVLPAIKFDPPFSGETDTGWRGEQGGAGKGDYSGMPGYNPATGMMEYPKTRYDENFPPVNMNQGVDITGGVAAAQQPAAWYDPIGMGMQAGQGVMDWMKGGTPGINLNPLDAGNAARQGIIERQVPGQAGQTAQGGGWWDLVSGGQTPPAGNNAPAGAPATPPPAGMAGPGNPETVAAWQATLDKNRGLNEKATAAGDTKEMARLQAEWDRIAPKAQKYGISAERLVNSYMQPGNDAAETSLDRALGRAIADDTWAQAAGVAFGRPPNQLEWDEHWRAMNKGGRDPLEGHPAAIQAIQAKMQEIEQENQNEAYGQYQQWLNNQ
jgi:hypothetical protein